MQEEFFNDSFPTLVLRFRLEEPDVCGSKLKFFIPVSNFINMYCGSPSVYQNYSYYPLLPKIGTNLSQLYTFDHYPGFDSGGNRERTSNYTLSVPGSRRNTDPASFSLVTYSSGCEQFNYCSGHGFCDFCLQKCHCMPGYGSDEEKLLFGPRYQIDPTCATSALHCHAVTLLIVVAELCPVGPDSFLAKLYPHKPARIVECSNSGTCDRAKGVCKCLPSFTGAACEQSKD